SDIRAHHTELDKLIVDRMIDPLLHMVRNAVSHGIDREGSLLVAARTAGGKVVIEIQNDGRGIDYERVAARARKEGLIAEGVTVNELNVLDILCSPGFSTR